MYLLKYLYEKLVIKILNRYMSQKHTTNKLNSQYVHIWKKFPVRDSNFCSNFITSDAIIILSNNKEK